MAPYIEMNTQVRKKATSNFEKNFFKLANNAVFGKTMESLIKRIRLDLVPTSHDDNLRKLIADQA